MRKYLPPMAELIDKLSVDLLKQRMLPPDEEVESEIGAIKEDILNLSQERGCVLPPMVVEAIIELAEANTRIWFCKDMMEISPDHYDKWLKLAHQINGFRNQSRNDLMVYLGDKSAKHTNTGTDGL